MDAQEITHLVNCKEDVELLQTFGFGDLLLDSVARSRIGGNIVSGFLLDKSNTTNIIVRLYFNNRNLQKIEIKIGYHESTDSPEYLATPDRCIFSSDEIEHIIHNAKKLNDFLEIIR